MELVCYEKVQGKQRRWYCISLRQGLFAAILVREWGRIGSRGRYLVDTFASEPERVAAMAKHSRLRERHGYVKVAEG